MDETKLDVRPKMAWEKWGKMNPDDPRNGWTWQDMAGTTGNPVTQSSTG